MSKKALLTPEEQQLFRDAVSNLDRLSYDKFNPGKSSKHFNQSRDPVFSDFIDYDTRNPVRSDDPISYARSGIQPRLLKKLKAGQFKIEATLDLHQKTIDEAIASAKRFISRCVLQRLRVVRMVHGKGYSSTDNIPILKNVLNSWLKRQSQILAFHSAQPKDGGTGALYVLIQSRYPHQE